MFNLILQFKTFIFLEKLLTNLYYVYIIHSFPRDSKTKASSENERKCKMVVKTTMPNRLTVGQRTLDPYVRVQILLRQPTSCHVGLEDQDVALSRRKSRVRIPHVVPFRAGSVSPPRVPALFSMCEKKLGSLESSGFFIFKFCLEVKNKIKLFRLG